MTNRKIETITRDIQGALKTSIQDRVKLGKLLNEARAVLKEDVKFGKWRSDNFSDLIDQKTAHNYMRLAECFGDIMPENIPISGLYILSKKENDDIRGAALSMLARKDKASIKDVADALDAAFSYIDDPKSHLKETQFKVEVMPLDYSREVILSIVERFGKETVMGWINEFDKKEAA